MKYVKILLFFIFVVYPFNNVSAKSAGTSGAILLRMPFDARNAAIGGAGTAFAGNVNCIENNPALAAFNDKVAISLSHIDILSEAQMNSFVYSEPLAVNKVITIYSKLLRSADIEKTELIDWDKYLKTGSFDVKDFIVGLSYSQHTSTPLQILNMNIFAAYGVTLKYYKSAIAEYSADAIAGDIGIYFQEAYSPISFGMSLLNVGSKIKYVSSADKLPVTFKAGITYNNMEYSKLILSADILWLRDETLKFALGCDFKVNKIFTIRTGYDSRSDIGMGYSVGFGLNCHIFKNPASALSIDYAYKPFEELGDYHYLTLTLSY